MNRKAHAFEFYCRMTVTRINDLLIKEESSVPTKNILETCQIPNTTYLFSTSI